MKKYLVNNDFKVKEYKDGGLVAEGDIPIALVAHLDTVGSAPPQDIYYDKEQDVMWSPQLLGADDRAGVYAIVDLVSKGYRPHIIFTRDEEKGCLGALELIKKLRKKPFKNLKYIVQIDRRGSEDCVFYECDNKDFNEFIESFGFKTAIGSFSDISVLCPQWGVAGVNLSSGYYNEHQLIETFKPSELDATIEKVANMLIVADETPKFKYIPLKYNFNNMYAAASVSATRCAYCGFPIQYGGGVRNVGGGADGKDEWLCDDCFMRIGFLN